MCSLSSIRSSIWGEGSRSLLQNNSGNLHQILLSRYFPEELKLRIRGRVCLGQAP